MSQEEQPRLASGQFGPLPKEPKQRMRLVAWRVPEPLIDRVRAASVPFNMPYQTFMRLLVEQGLQYLEATGALDIIVDQKEEKIILARQRAIEADQRAAFVAAHKAANGIVDDHPPPKKRRAPKKGAPSNPTPSVDTTYLQNGSLIVTPEPLYEKIKHTLIEPSEPAAVDTTYIQTEIEALEEQAGVTPFLEEARAAAVDVDTSVASLIRAGLSEPPMEGLVEALTMSTVPPPPDDDFGPLASEPGTEPPPETTQEDYDAAEQAVLEEAKLSGPIEQPDFVVTAFHVVAEPEEPSGEATILPMATEPVAPPKSEPPEDDDFAALMDSIPEPSSAEEAPPEEKQPEVDAHELESLLTGDSSLDADASHEKALAATKSEDDDIMDVLNQFASPPSNTDDDEHKPINTSAEVSAADFEDILGQL